MGYASWIVWTTSNVGSVTREHPAIMMEIGTYGQAPINIAAEFHTGMMTCSEKIRQMNELFENIKVRWN